MSTMPALSAHLPRLAVCALAALLTGCAALGGPPREAPPPAPALATLAPPAWRAAWPHGGDTQALTRWWQRFDEPLLAPLVAEAQQLSGDLAAARARIAQAEAARVAAAAALLPQVDAGVAASRSRQAPGLAPVGSVSASVQAGWEIDLFGGRSAGRDAAQARLDGAQADWHDARVAVAAEVANSLIALRSCEAAVLQAERDAASRGETARLAGLAARAGFQAPAEAALADASAAQARSVLRAQRAACDVELKALVALTGEDEARLIARLAPGTARVPQVIDAGLGAAGSAPTVPAQALAQRPDLRAAEQAVLAAAAEVAQADAQRLPRLALAGSIGAGASRSAGFSNEGLVWSLGPLQLSLPLFDGGSRRAEVQAAQARYDAAASAYRSRLRGAVREVEEALVRLQSGSERSADVQAAADGFARAERATEARYRGGLASLFELEDARRSLVQAQAGVVALQRERSLAWVQLYRALGGGWSPEDLR